MTMCMYLLQSVVVSIRVEVVIITFFQHRPVLCTVLLYRENKQVLASSTFLPSLHTSFLSLTSFPSLPLPLSSPSFFCSLPCCIPLFSSYLRTVIKFIGTVATGNSQHIPHRVEELRGSKELEVSILYRWLLERSAHLARLVTAVGGGVLSQNGPKCLPALLKLARTSHSHHFPTGSNFISKVEGGAGVSHRE